MGQHNLSPIEFQAARSFTTYRNRVLLLPLSIVFFLIGIGTFDDLAGKPADAPHLHLPPNVRGFLWVGLAVGAFLLLAFYKQIARFTRLDEDDINALAASLLIAMPAMRAVSYTWAFILSQMGEDNRFGIGHWWQEGSPTGWYGSLPWWGFVWIILALVVDWCSLRTRFRSVRRVAFRR